MKRKIIFVLFQIIAVNGGHGLLAQGKDPLALSVTNDTAALHSQAPAPSGVKHGIRLFSPAQYDSIIALVPSGESLRKASAIIGIGADSLSNDIVVIVFDDNGNPAKLVFPDSTLKKRTGPVSVANAAIKPEAPPKLDQRGRTWFIIESALKSAYVYPVAYTQAFNHADAGVISGISLLTIGGSLYGAFAFTKGMDLGYGKVGLMNYGSSALGLYYPQLAASLLHNATAIDRGNGNQDTAGPLRTSDRIKAWCSMLGFPLGIYLGSRWHFVGNDDAGKITLMGYFSQTAGFLLGYGLPLYFLNPGNGNKDYFGASAFLTMGLLPAGFYAGSKIAGDRPVSAGRGSLPYVSGIMGGLTGLLVPTLFDLDLKHRSTVRLLTTTTLIGYGGGTALGLTFHPAIAYTYWQTVFIGASSTAGALMGTAFPMIAGADDYKPYVVAGIIGAWTGFFLGERLSLSLFEKSDRDAHASTLRFNVPGLAALPSIVATKKSDILRKYGPEIGGPLPVANVEWKF